MKLLLDTHVAVWSLAYPERLSSAGRDLIADSDNTVFVSVVSIWEIAIKRALGRGNAPPLSAVETAETFGRVGFTMLNVSVAHAIAVETLPLLHGDPFDRLLVAQAVAEPLRLLTSDALVARYSDTFLRV